MEQQAEPTIVIAEDAALHQKLAKLVELCERVSGAEGRTQTIIPFLTIIRNTQPTPAVSAVLNPAFCLILQGAKRIHFGQEIIDCHAGNFLASVIHMPASTHINGATRFSPYTGLRVDFTTQEIAAVVVEAGINVRAKDKKPTIGAFIGKSDAALLDLFMRLLKLTDKPSEVPFLSALIKREMIFHLLKGEYGHLFFQQVFFDQQADGISKAIAWIKENYTRSFTVEELAKETNMSVSGLHHKFKAITTMGPIQYQKLFRLQEARRLMLSGSMDATRAALEVGYESPSQFSREYRRLFGQPPFKDIKALQTLAAAYAFEGD